MEHDTYETGDINAPAAILDRNGEVVLSLCKICGGAESSMPTECPGFRLSVLQLEDISDGLLDFRSGRMVDASNHASV